MSDDATVSLRYALSWIYGRDSRFSTLAEQKPDTVIEDLWLEFNSSLNLGLLPLVASTTKAWRQLSKARSEGLISLHGSRYVMGIPSPGRSGSLIAGIVEPIGEICRDLTEIGGPPRGVRWSEVALSRAPLMACFPKRPKEKVIGSIESQKLTKKMMLIKKALASLSDDVLLLDELDRHQLINEWIKENVKRSDGAVTVSPSSIKRYLKSQK